MIEYQAGDIWKCAGKYDDGELLIISVNGVVINAIWLSDKPIGDGNDVLLGNKYVNCARLYNLRDGALLDFIRSVPEEKMEEIRGGIAKALGLNRTIVTGTIQQDDDSLLQEIRELKEMLSGADLAGRDELIKIKAQRDVFKELYLRREEA